MRINQLSQRKTLTNGKTITFGEFVAGVYRTFGHRRAKAIVQLALELDMIKFHGKKRHLIS
jgi:hypothetical protein